MSTRMASRARRSGAALYRYNTATDETPRARADPRTASGRGLGRTRPMHTTTVTARSRTRAMLRWRYALPATSAGPGVTRGVAAGSSAIFGLSADTVA